MGCGVSNNPDTSSEFPTLAQHSDKRKAGEKKYSKHHCVCVMYGFVLCICVLCVYLCMHICVVPECVLCIHVCCLYISCVCVCGCTCMLCVHVYCECMCAVHTCVLYMCVMCVCLWVHVCACMLCMHVLWMCGVCVCVWCRGQVEFGGFFSCFTSCLCNGVTRAWLS